MARSFRQAFLILGAVALLIGLGGCSRDDQVTAPQIALPAADKDGTVVIEGEIGGAYYALYQPANWNGDLVVVAHGYYEPASGSLPGPDEFFISSCRDGLLPLGYGLAYSSYPSLGWSVQDGLRSLQQIQGIYSGRFGQPHETYLAGLSMGGLMVVAMAEQHPNQYAGVLAEAGPLAGGAAIFAQVFGIRAAFDYYYPGVLPGSVLDVPADADVWTALSAAVGAMITNPAPLMELVAIDQFEFRYNTPDELINAMMWQLYFQLVAANELVDRFGGSPLDNAQVRYSGTSDDDALNAGIARCTSTPRARQYMERYYYPTGRLRTPVLTLHNTLDPLVSSQQPEIYAERVAAQHCSEFLRQHTVERQDHGFPTEETVAAFQELVTWAESF